MFTVSDSIYIKAPLERCFLLSTNIELAEKTLGLMAVGGKTSGWMEAGDRVIWSGWKLLVPQRHESVVSQYERPTFFQDRMERGWFGRFHCDHRLYEMDGHTVVNDKLRFTMPMGWVGGLVGRYLVMPYISRMMRRRMQMLKRVAEGREWKRFMPDREEAA